MRGSVAVSTVGVTTNFPTASDNDGVYTFALNGNQATIEARTYTWHVTSTFGGSLVNAWIPYTPDQLRTAYSLHLFDATQTSIDDQTEDNATLVYPSPVDDVLSIAGAEKLLGDAIIRIYSASGQLVIEQQLLSMNQPVVTLHVGDLSAGVYVLQVTTNSATTSSRFVKR